MGRIKQKIDIVTIFPKMFESVLSETIIRNAQEKGIVGIRVHNLRDFSRDKHRSVDDAPYGGGPGMVLKPEPIFRAVGSIRKRHSVVVLLTPQGELFNQKYAQDLSRKSHLIFLCGRYEGIDERVKKIVDHEISVGDYVLSGGELPAMIVMDSVIRLIPGVLGNERSVLEDSFCHGLLDCPHYTRPRVYKRLSVPQVLLSGNHKKIEDWRTEKALLNTYRKRPELLRKRPRNKTDEMRIASLIQGERKNG